MENLIKRFDEAIRYLSPAIKEYLLNLSDELKKEICEIRLRNEKQIMLITSEGEPLFLCRNGGVSKVFSENLVICSSEELNACFQNMCNYSVHTHQKEINDGYICLKGGHRAGIAGFGVIHNGEVISVKDISSINLRIAKQVFGVSDILKSYFSVRAEGMLIAGKPFSGKTTLLRDLVRQLSNGTTGKMYRVLLADERGEIAAMNNGSPGNDIGYNCDVICGFPKSRAIEMGVRSLSPEIVVCDEIGSEAEAKSIKYALRCGAVPIATVHASNRSELLSKKNIADMIKDGVFKYVVFLESRGKIEEIVKANEFFNENTWNNLCLNDVCVDRNCIFTKVKEPLHTA